MTRYVSANFVTASNLILIMAGLSVGIYFFNGASLELFQTAISAMATLLIVVIALLIRQGYVWAKWVYVVLTILSLVALYFSIRGAFTQSAILGWLTVLQYVLSIAALILLFIPSKQPPIESTETTII